MAGKNNGKISTSGSNEGGSFVAASASEWMSGLPCAIHAGARTYIGWKTKPDEDIGLHLSLPLALRARSSTSTRAGLVHEMGLPIGASRRPIIAHVLTAEKTRAGLAIESVD